MKKEELFDLLEYVDDKYIEEAMLEEFDEARPVEIHAGSSRISPIKIVAPIAACLAVAIGAGFVISNKDKFAITTADSIVAESGSTNNLSELTLTEEEFVEKCKKIVAGESELIAQNDTTWQTRKLDIDFDGEDELLIYPQIDEKTISEVGVRVFRKTENGAEDLGSFGKDSEGIDLNEIRSDERDDAENQYYYCFSNHGINDLREGIRFISYHKNENTISDEKHLMLVTDTTEDKIIFEGTFENDLYSGSEQYFIQKIRDFPDDIVQEFCEFTNAEVAKCEKDALTRNGKLELESMLVPRMWHSGEYDINGDGDKELLISLFNFSNMRGVFVYDKNCEYLGSFETEDGLCDPELLGFYENGKEHYWYYLGVEGTVNRSGGYSSRLERLSVNKINVENNSFSTERLMHYDVIWDYDAVGSSNHYIYWIGDKEVSEKEFYEAAHLNISGMASHSFDLTDPNEWKYAARFEDSTLMGIGNDNVLNELKATIEYKPDDNELQILNIGLDKYVQLDMSKIPIIESPSSGLPDGECLNGILTSRKYGDYEIYLLGTCVYKVKGSDDILALNLPIVLAKAGHGIWLDHIKTEQFELGRAECNVLDPNELDDMINIIELESGTLIAFRLGDNDVSFFRIEDGKLEQMIPNEGYDNRLSLSKDFRVEGNAIIDKNYNHPFTFNFE